MEVQFENISIVLISYLVINYARRCFNLVVLLMHKPGCSVAVMQITACTRYESLPVPKSTHASDLTAAVSSF